MSLALSILSVLRNASPHLLPLSTLVAELRLRDRKEPLTEIRAELDRLEADRELVAVYNRDAGHKYKIADAGTVRLAEAGI